MKVRCGTGGASHRLATRRANGGKRQQLPYRLLFQRKRGRQQDGGIGLVVMDVVDAVLMASWSTPHHAAAAHAADHLA